MNMHDYEFNDAGQLVATPMMPCTATKVAEQFTRNPVVTPGVLLVLESSTTRVLLGPNADWYTNRALINWCGFGPTAKVIRSKEQVEVLA